MPGVGVAPTAAAQGMFADYGMNMNGMSTGMNMGMNFGAGQGMYGTWDGQNNMWNGGPDNFNGNAFPNRMGADFGPNPGFPGYNMSQTHANYPQMHQQNYPSNEFQGSFGSFGRGFGRGRGFNPGGRGRGGYNSNMQGNYGSANMGNFQRHPNFYQQQQQQQAYHNNTSATPGAQPPQTTTAQDEKAFNDSLCPGGEQELDGEQLMNDKTVEPQEDGSTAGAGGPSAISTDPNHGEGGEEPPISSTGVENKEGADDEATNQNGVCPIPSFTGDDVATASMRGGGFPAGNGVQMAPNGITNGPIQGPIPPLNGPNFMNNGMRGPGVVGAPAAPRAMREGLPNTSIRNNRILPPQGRPFFNQQPGKELQR